MGKLPRIEAALKKLSPEELQGVASEYVRRKGFPGLSRDIGTAACELQPDFAASATVKQIVEILKSRV